MGKTLLITCDYPPVQGGISNYLWHLWSALPAEKVVLLAPAAPGYCRWDAGSKYRIYRRPFLVANSYPGKLRQIVMLFVHTLSVLVKEDVKMIHGGHGISSGVACYLCNKLYGIPYCLYLYGGELEKYGTVGLPQNWFLPILNGAMALVACSEYTRVQYESYGVKNNFLVLSPAIDMRPFSSISNTGELKESYGLRGKRILLTVARMVEMKGHDMVIRCLPEIIRHAPDVTYMVVGTGPYRKKLEALARGLGVSAHVIFTGYVPDERLPAYYACCDVFVQLSRSIPEKGNVEGFGMVFLEASAAGKPVVGGRSGGTKEAIVDNETGFLVDPLNEKEISQVIVRLLRDKWLAQRMGNQGRERVASLFRWDTRVDALKHLLF